MSNNNKKAPLPPVAAPPKSPNPAPKPMPHPNQQPEFSLPELIDLALCSPEVGAVNFNILRIFLYELLKKFGYEHEPAHLDDVQSHQIQVKYFELENALIIKHVMIF